MRFHSGSPGIPIEYAWAPVSLRRGFPVTKRSNASPARIISCVIPYTYFSRPPGLSGYHPVATHAIRITGRSLQSSDRFCTARLGGTKVLSTRTRGEMQLLQIGRAHV